jgi:DNA repair protein RadC
VHNHPGGKVRPSYADKEITTALVAAAKSMDIEVHDHLIIGKDGYFSFRDSGLM